MFFGSVPKKCGRISPGRHCTTDVEGTGPQGQLGPRDILHCLPSGMRLGILYHKIRRGERPCPPVEEDGNCIPLSVSLLRPVRDSVHWRQHCFLGEGGSLCLPVDIVILIMVAAVIGLCSLPSGGAGVLQGRRDVAPVRLQPVGRRCHRKPAWEQGRADPGGENS